uniref:Uncharacterized protein n=1 Tax=Utricularia reniformis TaxID=192314 RepID=A0A1Y0B0F9_9LAMI|nr:hypothetical protein AEK19_MT0652 [Utricularia reniformis]ART30905.1 hypothetical protein AEK19_MT0652 [Utricularia reniformis]
MRPLEELCPPYPCTLPTISLGHLSIPGLMRGFFLNGMREKV